MINCSFIFLYLQKSPNYTMYLFKEKSTQFTTKELLNGRGFSTNVLSKLILAAATKNTSFLNNIF